MTTLIIGGIQLIVSHYDTTPTVPTRTHLPNDGKGMFSLPAYTDPDRMVGEFVEFAQAVFYNFHQADGVTLDCVSTFDLEQLGRQFLSELGDDFSELDSSELLFVIVQMRYEILNIREALDASAIAELDNCAKSAAALSESEREDYFTHITNTWDKPAAVQYVKDSVAIVA